MRGRDIVYLDGVYVCVSSDVLNVFTPGRLAGHGVFETMRSFQGKVEFGDAHLNRLMRGLKILRIRHHYSHAQLKNIVRQVVKKNPAIALGRVRVMVFKEQGTAHGLVSITQYRQPPLAKYRKGLKVMFIKTNRLASTKFAQVKSLDYGLFTDAYNQARSQGYDEALLINARGHVFEASRANVFIVSNGQLFTPPLSSGCLNGIIRGQVMEFARRQKHPVLERNLTEAMVRSAQAIFLTNSMAGIIPAVV